MDVYSKTLFWSELPPLQTIECHTISLSAELSRPQAIQMKCRELARSDASILLAPKGDKSSAYILGEVGYLRNDNLKARLHQYSLRVVSESDATEDLVAMCYVFTVRARLTPKWNSVDNFLVQGMEFLNGGRSGAVDMLVTVKNRELAITIQPVNLVTRQLKPEDLGIALPVLKGFNSGRREQVEETEMEGRRCLVLPKCATAYVKSVSSVYSSIPSIPTYNHLRLYWKKQHGYVIPDTESLYYTIYFQQDPNTFKIYPGCCVLKSPPHSSRTREGRKVALSFINDILQRLPSVCGHSLSFEEKNIGKPSLLQASSRVLLSTPQEFASCRSDQGKQERVPNPPTIPPSRTSHNRGIVDVAQDVETKPSGHESKTLIIPRFTSSTHLAHRVNSFRPKNPPHQSNNFSTPTATNVCRPTATEVSRLTATNVSKPTATNVSKPTATNVSKPTATNVSKPTATNVSKPTATNVSKPTATNVSRTVATNKPTATNSVSRPTTSNLSCAPGGFGVSTTPFCQVPTVGDIVEDDDFSLFPSGHKSTGSRKCIDPLSPSKMKQITKLKVADLKKWLWQNGIKFKAKGTKKEDLIKLVVEHIRQTGNAFQIDD